MYSAGDALREVVYSGSKVDNMMNAKAAATMTKGPDKPVGKPVFPSPEPIDLDRVVFDPEYRARVRDALNRAGPMAQSRPVQEFRRKDRAAA